MAASSSPPPIPATTTTTTTMIPPRRRARAGRVSVSVFESERFESERFESEAGAGAGAGARWGARLRLRLQRPCPARAQRVVDALRDGGGRPAREFARVEYPRGGDAGRGSGSGEEGGTEVQAEFSLLLRDGARAHRLRLRLFDALRLLAPGVEDEIRSYYSGPFTPRGGDALVRRVPRGVIPLRFDVFAAAEKTLEGLGDGSRA
ncbi:hypothetical protein F4809DRAFT_637138 [Biscogniauxia mediterranea]|nr:hypothetical protein F4809DRAFT_637138 [Biscogniauxia mediterranea]